ncbi:MAG: zinc ribbon domain-containing protein [Solirubrobacterales bacterium]
MPLAIFGIENTAINLVVTFAILCVAAIYLATIVYVFTDARRRIADPFLVGCATAASIFPFVGTIVYTILRPPEFLEDVRERETEVHASEVRLKHLEAHSCHKCGYPTETDFVRCPSCRTRLKAECPTCSRPVGIDWKLCPYCETQLVAPKRSSRSSSKPGSKPRDPERAEKKRRRSKETPEGQPQAAERSSSRKSSRSSSSDRDSGRRKAPSSEETVESAAARPSSDDRPERSSRRTPRSARRNPSSSDDSPSKPINSGDSPAPSRSPESR